MAIVVATCSGPGVDVGKPSNVATAECCGPSCSRCREWNSTPTALRSGERSGEGVDATVVAEARPEGRAGAAIVACGPSGRGVRSPCVG